MGLLAGNGRVANGEILLDGKNISLGTNIVTWTMIGPIQLIIKCFIKILEWLAPKTNAASLI